MWLLRSLRRPSLLRRPFNKRKRMRNSTRKMMFRRMSAWINNNKLTSKYPKHNKALLSVQILSKKERANSRNRRSNL